MIFLSRVAALRSIVSFACTSYILAPPPPHLTNLTVSIHCLQQLLFLMKSYMLFIYLCFMVCNFKDLYECFQNFPLHLLSFSSLTALYLSVLFVLTLMHGCVFFWSCQAYFILTGEQINFRLELSYSTTFIVRHNLTVVITECLQCSLSCLSGSF